MIFYPDEFGMSTTIQGPAVKQVRRRFPRRNFRRGVGILSGGRYFLGTGAEIGEGGISFKSVEKLVKGASVVVSFQIPDGQFVSVRAEIRNLDPGSESTEMVYGCAFENIPFERKREIRNFVTNRPETEF